MLRLIKRCLSTGSSVTPDVLSEARRLCGLDIVPPIGESVREWPTCPQATALLTRTSLSVLNEYRPLLVSGDGNCFFRSVSVLLYGTERYHDMLRLKAIVEIVSNRQLYDSGRADCLCPFVNDGRVVLPTYEQLCDDVATDGSSVDMLAAYAVSRAVGRRFQLYFPPLAASEIHCNRPKS